jgi:hypothetical protein
MNTQKSKSNNENNQIDTSIASGGKLPQKQIVKKLKAKSKKRRESTAAQKTASKAVRLALREKSQDAKDIRSLNVETAKTPLEALEAANTTLNYIIVGMYKNETGCKQFKTFHDWKKAGYAVNKGSKAFAVWGTPKRVKETAETEDGEVLEGESWEFWPLCYLFNENQVTKKGDPEPTKDDDSTEEKTDGTLSTSEPATESNVQTVVNAKLVEESQAGETSETEKAINPAFITTDYEERQEAKKDRLEDRAAAKRKQSNEAYTRSHSLVENIPFGQPILVGHHSETRHRNAVDKSWNLLGKSVGLDKEAASLESRASSVGGGGISSTDPEAVTKLKEKLLNLEESQDTMKAVNKIIRSKNMSLEQKQQKIVNDELLDVAHAKEILTPSNFGGGVGFASYSLSNNNAEISRLKKRIKSLESLRTSEGISFENDNFSMNINNGQIVIDFSGGKPNEEIRKLVGRAYSFKWSRYQGAWVRKVTLNAMNAANRLLEELKTIEEMY